MITWHCPAAGTNRASPSRSVALSNTTRHRSPSASSRCRTASPSCSRSAPGSPTPRAAATSASPFSTVAGSAALTHATSRQPSSIRDRAYAAASCVLPTPRIPVTARTTVTPGPLAPSGAISSARGWNAGARCGTSPTTTGPCTGYCGQVLMFDIRLDVLVNLLIARADLHTLSAGNLRPRRSFAGRESCLPAALHQRDDPNTIAAARLRPHRLPNPPQPRRTHPRCDNTHTPPRAPHDLPILHAAGPLTAATASITARTDARELSVRLPASMASYA